MKGEEPMFNDPVNTPDPMKEMRESLKQSLREMPPQVRYITLLEIASILAEEVDEAKIAHDEHMKKMEADFNNLLLNFLITTKSTAK
jgi:hypothetical protein